MELEKQMKQMFGKQMGHREVFCFCFCFFGLYLAAAAAAAGVLPAKAFL